MNSPDRVSVGIVSAGMYLPEPVLTAADIAEQSGLPEWVVREKLGINQKHMAGPDDHPNQMAIWAAQDCLSKCDIPQTLAHRKNQINTTKEESYK